MLCSRSSEVSRCFFFYKTAVTLDSRQLASADHLRKRLAHYMEAITPAQKWRQILRQSAHGIPTVPSGHRDFSRVTLDVDWVLTSLARVWELLCTSVHLGCSAYFFPCWKPRLRTGSWRSSQMLDLVSLPSVCLLLKFLSFLLPLLISELGGLI